MNFYIKQGGEKMICKKCNSVIDDNSLFCNRCGTAVEQKSAVCSVCGTLLPENALFCKKCGLRVVPARSETSYVKDNISVVSAAKDKAAYNGTIPVSGAHTISPYFFCKNCGYKINPKSKYCPKCGKYRGENNKTDQSDNNICSSQTAVNNTNYIKPIIITIVSLIIFALMISQCDVNKFNVSSKHAEYVSIPEPDEDDYEYMYESTPSEPTGSHSVSYQTSLAPMLLSSTESWFGNDKSFSLEVTGVKVEVSPYIDSNTISVFCDVTNITFNTCKFKNNLKLDNNGVVKENWISRYGSTEISSGTTVKEKFEFYFPSGSNTDIDKMILKTDEDSVELYYDGE